MASNAEVTNPSALSVSLREEILQMSHLQLLSFRTEMAELERKVAELENERSTISNKIHELESMFEEVKHSFKL